VKSCYGQGYGDLAAMCRLMVTYHVSWCATKVTNEAGPQSSPMPRPFPQSNALAAMAGLLCRHWGRRLLYYTKDVPLWLKAAPIGNYATARQAGVEVRGIVHSR
jgi:hypothetical protein